jgi:general transcription factor 3C polypeptide 3 (transcription factor C subunit 4)
MYVLTQTAACRRAMGDNQEAAEVYEHSQSSFPSTPGCMLIRSSSDHGRSNEHGYQDEARRNIRNPERTSKGTRSRVSRYSLLSPRNYFPTLTHNPVIDARRRRIGRSHEEGTPMQEEDPGSLFIEQQAQSKDRDRSKKSGQKKPTLDQLRALEAEKEKETLQGYARAQELWPRLIHVPPLENQAEVEREWMIEVEPLVDMFRSTRRLFQSSKVSALETMGKCYQLTLCQDPFRGMLRTTKKKSENEADDMASRLHLNMGQYCLSIKTQILTLHDSIRKHEG